MDDKCSIPNNIPECQGISREGGMYSIDGMIEVKLDVVNSADAIEC